MGTERGTDVNSETYREGGTGIRKTKGGSDWDQVDKGRNGDEEKEVDNIEANIFECYV